MSRKTYLVVATVISFLAFIVVWFPKPDLRIQSYAQDEDTLTAIQVDKAPALDGVADEAFWKDALPIETKVRGGANESKTTVAIKSVYTGDMVYFLVTWEDPTESFLRAPWEMQADGAWKKLKDPDDKGGDNNLYYEDKLAFIWPINNSIPDFEQEGCFTVCHKGENKDVKPYGNKYTEEEGQTGDIWHWKSVRSLNQVDDQYLDWTPYSEKSPEAGRKSDPKDKGGYKDNVNEQKTGPAFMPGGKTFAKDGSPGYILESDAVPIDPSVFKAGDRVPGIVKSEFVGDRGDIAAGSAWKEGVWTLELGRKLVTGSEFDVQFNDLAATYYFGVAVFDNAQVRHSYQSDPTPFVFKK